MPAFGDQLDDEQIDAFLTYLKTSWNDEQRESQAAATAEQCGP